MSQPGDFGVATAAPTRKAFAMPDVKPPTEWLSDIHDAGSTAVQEWLEKAKEKAKDGEGKIGVMPGMKFKFGPPGGVGAGWKRRTKRRRARTSTPRRAPRRSRR